MVIIMREKGIPDIMLHLNYIYLFSVEATIYKKWLPTILSSTEMNMIKQRPDRDILDF